MSESSKTPSLFGRVAAAASFVMTGKAPASWFGPAQPIAPQAPPSVAGRQFDYAPATNLSAAPRADEDVSASDLRALADNCDVLRLVIETRKDQLAPIEWQFRLKDKSRRKEVDPRVQMLTDFWQSPDREHSWEEWLRPLLDDLLVIDAPTIYPRRTLGGEIYGFDYVDGGTIKRVIDDHGRTPMPPQAAYQQILHGLPAVNYSRDELLYFPRNQRSYKLYGLSPTQQVMMTVNIALRRSLHQLEFYTAGTTPDALVGAPENWTPEQINQYQDFWDELLTDDTAARRRVRFVPGGMAKGFVQTKQNALKDDFDEWLARVVCYAFSVSPQWAIKQMNRSTGETAQEMANAEGLAPLQRWVKSMVNRCVLAGWGWTDIEFAWREEEASDPVQQATVATTYLKAGVLTVNQVLADIGREPIAGGDVNLIYTASGAVPLRDVLAPPPPPPNPEPGVGHNGGPALDQDEEDEALSKAADPVTRMAATWHRFFLHAAPAVADAVAVAVEQDATPLSKAAGDEPPSDDPDAVNLPARTPHPDAQAAEEEAARIASAIEASVERSIQDAVRAMPWPAVQASTADALATAATAGVTEGVVAARQVAGISVGDATRLANPRAVQWAQDHAAELVKGVENTTRDALNRLVTQAKAEGWSAKQLVDRIVADYAFSKERATVIARTEGKRASSAGNLESWRASARITGLIYKKRVILGMNENHCAVCRSAVLEGAIPIDEEWSAGAMPPFHPSCYCNMVPVTERPSMLAKAAGHRHGLFCDGGGH